jgi:hypothetical protein
VNTTDKLAEALRDAATSLETIGRLAGKPYYGRDDQGEPIQTYMGHNDEVRSYAKSRAGCAREALAAHDAEQAAKAVPAGFKLVPVEPTPKMIERGRWDEFGEDCTRAYPVPDYYVTDVWAAMLEAAPTPPAPEAQQAAGQEQDERDAFEAWADSVFYSGLASVAETWNYKVGRYFDAAHQMAWQAWQAAMTRAREALAAHEQAKGGEPAP